MSNIKEDRWYCTECGINQGRNDIWFECDVCGDCHVQKTNTKKKDMIEEKLIDMFDRIGIEMPTNLEDITQYCFEYLIIDENYNVLSDLDNQVAFAFKLWVQQQK
jgi:hypothetical protein